MSKQTKIDLEQEVRDRDMHEIAAVFRNNLNGLAECETRIIQELERIRAYPDQQGKLCEYEPLKSAGCRKVKMFSSHSLQRRQGEKPDMRIIYRYDEDRDIVRVDSIGFRRKEKPRPERDPYSKAEQRVLKRQQN